MKIMIVDDSKFMCTLIRGLCERLGHIVVAECATVDNLLQSYPALLPDVITMDINLDGINGIDGARMLKIMHPQARIIMCSSMGQQAFMLDAIQAGASDFVTKPIKMQSLAAAFDRIKTVV